MQRRPPPNSEAAHKLATARAAARYHVPFWLLWGTAGAESTWGEGGTNLFGLLAAAEGANISNWESAANQAAKTYAGLIRSYGSIAAAVPHYSGNSYTVAHVKQLAGERGGYSVKLPSGPAAPEPPSTGRSGAPGGLPGDLMHFGLVGVLVIAGFIALGMGLTRVAGASKGTA